MDDIINQIDLSERLNDIEDKVDKIRDKQVRETSFFGLLFLVFINNDYKFMGSICI